MEIKLSTGLLMALTGEKSENERAFINQAIELAKAYEDGHLIRRLNPQREVVWPNKKKRNYQLDGEIEEPLTIKEDIARFGYNLGVDACIAAYEKSLTTQEEGK